MRNKGTKNLKVFIRKQLYFKKIIKDGSVLSNILRKVLPTCGQVVKNNYLWWNRISNLMLEILRNLLNGSQTKMPGWVL